VIENEQDMIHVY